MRSKSRIEELFDARCTQAGGAPDGEGAVAVADPPAKEGETPAKPTVVSEEPETPSAPASTRVRDPRSGQLYDVPAADLDHVLAKGIESVLYGKETAADTEPKPKEVQVPEDKSVTPDDGGDDGEAAKVMAEVNSLRQQLEQTQAKTDALEKGREADRKADKKRHDEVALERENVKLARKHKVPQDNEELRDFVESRTMRNWGVAVAANKPVAYEEVYADSVKAAEKMLGQDRMDWFRAKVDAGQKATEAGGGAPPLTPVAPRALPESKAEQRKLAAEMRDGTVQERAMDTYRRRMSALGHPVEAAG